MARFCAVLYIRAFIDETQPSLAVLIKLYLAKLHSFNSAVSYVAHFERFFFLLVYRNVIRVCFVLTLVCCISH